MSVQTTLILDQPQNTITTGVWNRGHHFIKLFTPQIDHDLSDLSTDHLLVPHLHSQRLCRICIVVQIIQPRKHALDHAESTGPTRQHELDNTNKINNESSICLERSRSSSRNDLYMICQSEVFLTTTVRDHEFCLPACLPGCTILPGVERKASNTSGRKSTSQCHHRHLLGEIDSCPVVYLV